MHFEQAMAWGLYNSSYHAFHGSFSCTINFEKFYGDSSDFGTECLIFQVQPNWGAASFFTTDFSNHSVPIFV